MNGLVSALVVALLVLPGAASAQQAITGTLALSPGSFDQYGAYSLEMDLGLSCSLACGPSAPDLHFAVEGGGDFLFSQNGERFDSPAATFLNSVDPTGRAMGTKDGLPAGASYYVHLSSATCWCGNATGQGGFIDIDSNEVRIAPLVLVIVDPFVANDPGNYVTVTAAPRGTETVTVAFAGAGADATATYGPTDFQDSSNQGAVMLTPMPTSAGHVTITATLEPYGVSQTKTVSVLGDGGTAADGGNGGSGGDPGGGGCGCIAASGSGDGATGGLVAGGVVALRILRRRSRSRRSIRSA